MWASHKVVNDTLQFKQKMWLNNFSKPLHYQSSQEYSISWVVTGRKIDGWKGSLQTHQQWLRRNFSKPYCSKLLLSEWLTSVWLSAGACGQKGSLSISEDESSSFGWISPLAEYASGFNSWKQKSTRNYGFSVIRFVSIWATFALICSHRYSSSWWSRVNITSPMKDMSFSQQCCWRYKTPDM